MLRGFHPMRAFSLLALFILCGMMAFAGQPMMVFVPDDGDLSTNSDDLARAVSLSWPEDMTIQFYLAKNEASGGVVLSAVNDHNLMESDIQRALVNTLKTWNGARWGKFKFQESVPPTTFAPRVGPDQSYQPMQASLDGFNVITFLDTESNVDQTMAAKPLITFFIRDFSASDFMDAYPYPADSLNSFSFGAEQQTTLMVNFDGDLDFDMFLPYQDYKAGNLVDVDIVMNQSAIPFLYTWPDDPQFEGSGRLAGDQLPEGAIRDPSVALDYIESNLAGSLDVQAIMTYALGQARGLAPSLIVDSAMYPFFLNGTGATGFKSVPTEKRKLSFDDELAVGLTDGSDFGGSSLGTIAGVVIEGSVIDGFQADTTDAEGEVDVEIDTTDLPVVQAPVYLMVQPDEIAITSALNGGKRVPQLFEHPDDVVSQPLVTADNPNPEQRVMRKVAQVLTGQNLLLAAGVGDMFFPLPDVDTGTGGTGGTGEQPGGGGDTGAGDTADDADLGFSLYEPKEHLDSTFMFPGLPVTRGDGEKVRYGIYIDNTVEFEVNAVMAGFLVSYPEEFDPEFYGGTTAQIEAATGLFARATTINDSLFANGYLTAQVVPQGRFAAEIIGAGPFLSGFDTAPQSFIQLRTPKGVYDNQTVNIGVPLQGMVIRDDPGSASGSWVRGQDFELRMNMRFSEAGGIVGIPDGVEVSYTVVNLSDKPGTFTLTQVLDATLLGLENPLYTIDNIPVDREITLFDGDVPRELLYQTSLSNPALRSYVTLRGVGLTVPDRVTIATLGNLGKAIEAGQGAKLSGVDSIASDSGVALTWNKIYLAPAQSQTVRFVTGLLPVGSLLDTWVALTDATADETVTGEEDDPDRIELITLDPGEVRDDVIVVTNTGAANGSGNRNRNLGDAAGSLLFDLIPDGFPQTNYMHAVGALGDIDLDGDLDLVVGGVRGGTDASTAINRLYENRQRINVDGSISYFYKEVTFGEDGQANTDDDRLPPTDQSDTLGAAMEDFDLDGDLDIFFSSRLAPDRYFENLGPAKPGFFADRSAEVLPGALNRGWANSFGVADSTRCATGDIDGDGDMDIIVSLNTPLTDERYDATGSLILAPTKGYIDAGPREANPFSIADNRPNSQHDLWAGDLEVAERVLINMSRVPTYQSRHAQGMYFMDQTLGDDNRFGTQTDIPLDMADSVTTQSNLVRIVVNAIDRMPPVFPATISLAGRSEGSPAITVARSPGSPMGRHAWEPRLAPFFYDSSLDLVSVRSYDDGINVNAQMTLSLNIADDFINEGVIFIGRSESSGVGNDPAFFRNTDIFDLVPEDPNLEPFTFGLGNDGVADGFFACINYNMDYGSYIGNRLGFNTPAALDPFQNPGLFNTQWGPGLFAYRFGDSTDPDTFQRDYMGLLIGIPASNPANIEFPPGNTAVNFDFFPSAPGGGLTGVVADFFGDGSPRPLLFADTTEGVNDTTPFTYDDAGTADPNPAGWGVLRGRAADGGLSGNYGNNYNPNYGAPQAGYDATVADAYTPWVIAALPQHEDIVDFGQVMSATAGDFDRDGSVDVIAARSTLEGIQVINSGGAGGHGFIINGLPVDNRAYINDGLGVFTIAPALSLRPNPAAVSLYALNGDLNNDGDLDLVVLNALQNNFLYDNKAFFNPPDLGTGGDPTMFYDTTVEMLPPIYSGGQAQPFDSGSELAGQTLNTTVADFDMDGMPDLVLAEGGAFSQNGDHLRMLFNRGGRSRSDAVTIFQPMGSNFPAPRLNNTLDLTGEYLDFIFFTTSVPSNGFLGPQSYFRDVVAGDVDNDGDPDMVSVQGTSSIVSTLGPQLYRNLDSSEFGITADQEYLLNSLPDSNTLGDGLMKQDLAGIPPLFDAYTFPGSTVILKRQGNRVRMADINQDGLLDILIANGYEGVGAPNVALLNNPASPGNFIDVTDVNGNNFLPIAQVPNAPAGTMMGVLDNTRDLVVADFDGDNSMEIIFANASNGPAPLGFRYLDHNENAPGEGLFVDTAPGSHVPEFAGTTPYAMAIADFDGIGEPTEDKNFNGYLDAGEDTNNNGLIDWEDLPSETEDANGNGLLDAGEDVGIIGEDGTLTGDGDNELTQFDRNNDGFYTYRRPGLWDGSLDVYVTFENDIDHILFNDPTNTHAGTFVDLPLDYLGPTPSRGVDVGDIDLDGDIDIVVAQYRGGVTQHVLFLQNTTVILPGGNVKRGVFVDRSESEVPYVSSRRDADDTTLGEQDASMTGWISDVDLIDVDRDGDLDLMCSGLGGSENPLLMGSLNFFYTNRIVGDNWNALTRQHLQPIVTPEILMVDPGGAMRGQVQVVDVQGQHFDSDVRFSFGPGINVLDVDATTSGTAKVTLEVLETASFGPRRVMVENPTGGGTAVTKMGAFRVFEELDNPYRNEVPNRYWAIYN